MRLSPPSAGSILSRVRFAAEEHGDPLAAFPSLRREGLPYNGWLAERVLAPALERWRTEVPSGPPAADVARASEQCRLAFAEAVGPAEALGDAAVLAVLGVTANLQRTLGLVAEWIGDPVSFLAWSGREPRLSRLWCGLVDYPEHAPYFPGRVRAPAHPSRLNPRRRDPRHLTNALWCSPATVQARCDEALARLRHELGPGGRFEPGAFPGCK